MEAFSDQHSTFPLQSVFLPSNHIKMSGLLEEGDVNPSCFSYYQSEPLQEIPIDVRIQESSCVDNSTKHVELDSGDQVSHKETSMEKKRKDKDGSCLSSVKSQEAKSKRQKKCNGRKETEQKKSRADKKKLPEEPPTCYIHVRARRGEATDSHSLAERVRREKISMRMKFLQGLVPGCDKVSGKAHMLDEIINYVQSLQYQVEFLSMKLACLNPMSHDFAADFDAFMVKPEELSSLASPLPPMHQTNPTQPTDFADTTTTFTTTNNYPLQDNSVSVLYQQGQRPNTFSQDNENLLWDVDDQRQRFFNQYGLNNLCSFH